MNTTISLASYILHCTVDDALVFINETMRIKAEFTELSKLRDELSLKTSLVNATNQRLAEVEEERDKAEAERDALKAQVAEQKSIIEEMDMFESKCAELGRLLDEKTLECCSTLRSSD